MAQKKLIQVELNAIKEMQKLLKKAQQIDKDVDNDYSYGELYEFRQGLRQVVKYHKKFFEVDNQLKADWQKVEASFKEFGFVIPDNVMAVYNKATNGITEEANSVRNRIAKMKAAFK